VSLEVPWAQRHGLQHVCSAYAHNMIHRECVRHRERREREDGLSLRTQSDGRFRPSKVGYSTPCCGWMRSDARGSRGRLPLGRLPPLVRICLVIASVSTVLLRRETPQLQHNTVTAQRIYLAFESSAFRSPSPPLVRICQCWASGHAPSSPHPGRADAD
jgi:hypothetical protein